MADVIRNAVIRLAIESGQSQLVLPNVDGLIAGQKAAQAATQGTTAAMMAQSEAAQILRIDAAMLAAADAQLAREELAAAEAVQAAAAAQMQLTSAGRSLERGTVGLLRGLSLVAVASGEVDAKSLQMIIGIEGAAGAARAAGQMWVGYTRFAEAAAAANMTLAESAALLVAEYAPIIAIGAAVVGIGYEIEQAWTADARAAKAAEEQTKKNFDEERKSLELTADVARAYGRTMHEIAEEGIRDADRHMEAARKNHEEEQRLLSEASREFNMKPLERMRLDRDRGTMNAGGQLTDRELSWYESHATGSEQHSLQRIEQRRLRSRGGNAQFSDGEDEEYQSHMDRAMSEKGNLEAKGRSIEQRVVSILNAIDARLREGEEQMKQQKAAKIAADAAAASGPAFGGAFHWTGSPGL